MSKIVKVEKKYALNNSYFKNRKYNYPDTLLEIVHYWREFCELPFEYGGDNWVFDTMVERQKRSGVINSQHLTPDQTARQLVELTNNFIPKDHKVLDACCGTGQLTKYLLENKFHVTGFDADPEMVEICTLLYPESTFSCLDFRGQDNEVKWDLIVSNPPHEQKDLIPFLKWLSTALTNDGKAILLLPKDFLAKQRPSKLAEYVKRFNILHSEAVTERFAYSNCVCEIHILALAENFKTIKTNKYQQIVSKTKTGRIMENTDLRQIQDIALTEISINPLNPRKRINEKEIEELAQGIKKIGLLHPITLRYKDDKLQIVAGECRYRAFVINRSPTIPAIIKELSDEEVMQIALEENLKRKNLTPIEEGNAFLYLMDNFQHKTEDIALKFGKTEAYVRGRLRLLRLIDEFRTMLDDNEITYSMGFEISKYSNEIQHNVYQEHFVTDDNTCWKYLSIKDFSSRVERLYTTDLSKFMFDKTACQTCPYNTEVYDLFTDVNQGRCTNNECLKQKKSEYTLSFCKVQAEKNPAISVCISPFDKVPEEFGAKLKNEGLDVQTIVQQEYPEPPVKPDPALFKMNFDYEKALEEYKIEEMAYYHDIEEIETKIEKGELQKYVYIGDNNPKICYAPVNKTKNSDPVAELMEQDIKNKENAIKVVYKESIEVLKNNPTPDIDFTVFEEEVLLFLLLDFLNKKNFALFGITDEKKTRLTDKDKEVIIKNITSIQRAILQRDFILKHFPNSTDPKFRVTFLLTQLSLMHFPAQTQAIVNKHMGAYQNSNKLIMERIKKIKQAKEKKQLSEQTA